MTFEFEWHSLGNLQCNWKLLNDESIGIRRPTYSYPTHRRLAAWCPHHSQMHQLKCCKLLFVWLEDISEILCTYKLQSHRGMVKPCPAAILRLIAVCTVYKLLYKPLALGIGNGKFRSPHISKAVQPIFTKLRPRTTSRRPSMQDHISLRQRGWSGRTPSLPL